MKSAQCRAKSTIFTHDYQCASRFGATLCPCGVTLCKGDQFTILGTTDEGVRRYFIVFTSFGLKMFYCLAIEQELYFDVVSETAVPAGQAA